MLSPSALSIYIQCSLRFYFKSVAKVREADEIDEVVDARLFGNIFHKAAEFVYAGFFENNSLVTKQGLEELIQNKEFIDKVLFKSFSQVFFGEKTSRTFKVEGKNKLVFNVIKKYLLRMLNVDKECAPFSIVGLEEDVAQIFDFQIDGNKYEVLLGGQVDRLDRTDNELRVIDYKTGSDKLTFNHVDDVFSSEHIKDTKAVFQTFVYSYLLSNEFKNETIIKPMVYQVKSFFAPKNSFEISSSKYVPYVSGNFIDIADEVKDRLKTLLGELFNSKIPFKQTEDLAKCKNCPYKNMCGR